MTFSSLYKYFFVLLLLHPLLLKAQDSPDEALIKAIQVSDLVAMKKAIANGADVNKVGQYAYVPLNWAINMQKPNLIKFLVEKGANPNYKNPQGQALIFQPCMLNWYSVLQALLENGADANAVDGIQATPLISAARSGAVECVKLLIPYTKNIDQKDIGGQTALLYAINAEKTETVRLLIEAKADLRTANLSGETGLHLLANQHVPNLEILQLLIKSGTDLDATDSYGRTALHLATADGKFQVCKLLVNAGADISLKNGSGENALEIAQSGEKELLVAFLQNPKKIDKAEVKDDLLFEQLIKAIRSRASLAQIQALVEKGAPINQAFSDGWTPLFQAINIHQDEEVISYLIEQGADVKRKEEKGYYNSTFHYAALFQLDFLLPVLLEKGADINAQNKDGVTPLQMSLNTSNGGDFHTAKWLLKNGANPNLKNTERQTVKEFLKANGNMEAVVFLENPEKYRTDLIWQVQHVFPRMESKAKSREETIASIEKAIVSLSEKERFSKVFLYSQLADYLVSIGKYKEAEKALKEANRIGNYDGFIKAEAQGNLAKFYKETYRLEEAERAVEMGKELLKGVKDSTYFKLQTVWAQIQQEKGDLEIAESYFNSCIKQFGTQPETANSALYETYQAAAEFFLRKGDFAQSNILFQSASTMSVSVFGIQSPKWVRHQHDYAYFWLNANNPLQAEAHIKQSLREVSTQLGTHHPLYLESLHLMAEIQMEQSNYAAAELLYDMVRSEYRQTFGESYLPLAMLHADLASLYKNEGNYELALQFAQKSANVLSKVSKEHPAYLKAIQTIASIQFDMGEYTGLETTLKEVARGTEKRYGIQSPAYLKASSDLAKLYLYSLNREKFAVSEQLLKQNVEAYQKLAVKNALNNFNQFNGLEQMLAMSDLARLYHEEGKNDLAKNWYEKAIYNAALDHKSIHFAKLYVDFAKLEYLENGVQSKSLLLQGIKIYEQLLESVFPSLSEREKSTFFNSIREDFNFFNYYALQNHKTEPSLAADMYNHQLVTKALVLTSTRKIREGILNSGDEKLIEQYKNWKEIRGYLANLHLPEEELKKRKINVDSLENVANRLEKDLAVKSRDFADLSINQKRTWQDVKSKLKPQEAAIEIIRIMHGQKPIYVALIVTSETADYPELVELPEGTDMEGKYLKFYRTATEYKIEDKNSYKKYWQPIRQQLEQGGRIIKRVYLSPDGIYNQINLKGLWNGKSGKYLIDELDIEPVTRTDDLLAYNGKSILKKGKAFVLGKPTYKIGTPDSPKTEKLGEEKDRALTSRSIRKISVLKDAEFSVLEGTEVEVNGIAKVLTEYEWEIEKRLGEEATESAVKLALSSQIEIAHIATHGFFIGNTAPDSNFVPSETRAFMPIQPNRQVNGLDPMLQSGVVLAGVNDFDPTNLNSEDGILTAYEVMNLDLSHVEIFVLSACETGLGELRTGEGVYGLQRALKVAGAKSIIISLWKVSDEATQMLMNEFYRSCLSIGNKQAAFQNAQQKVRQVYPDPYYWAAFVMVGE